ncbi:hypothetical protein F4810DRAFT_711584 [Camillea tinctor]|nr:hypothetical protein F4810DRAFT_711584 [Camillea tinctor]
MSSDRDNDSLRARHEANLNNQRHESDNESHIANDLQNNEIDDDEDDTDESVSVNILNESDSQDDEDSDDEHLNFERGSSESPENYDLRQRIEQLTEALRHFQAREKELKGTIHALNGQIAMLEDMVDRLKNGNPAPERWYELFRRGLLPYSTIYRECCKQEDMSQVVSVTHPDLIIVRKGLSKRKLRKYNSPPRRQNPNNSIGEQPFPFENLPIDIQARSNTFAFSSLGEMGLFFNGIGQARAERVVNIELMWHGSKMTRAKRLDEKYGLPQETRKVSQRTVPLTWLMKTKRLRTFVVHIEEAHKRRMRRYYEMQDEEHYHQDWANDEQYADEWLDIWQRMVRRTDLHANYRKNRSMRTVHGMDYMYQLRGMKWIRFYEIGQNRIRNSIRDWTFMKDLCSVTTLPKSQKSAFDSQIENLTPLKFLENWQPSDDDFRLVKRFYDDAPAEDQLMDGYDSSTGSDAPTNQGDFEDDDNDDDNIPEIDLHSIDDNQFRQFDEDEDMSDASSTVSSRSTLSNASDSDQDDDDGPPHNTQQTSIPSQLNNIVDLTIRDGDENNEGAAGPPSEETRSSSGLFVPWGSVSAATTANNNRIIDLTLDDDDEEPRIKTEIPHGTTIDLTIDDSEEEEEEPDIKVEEEEEEEEQSSSRASRKRSSAESSTSGASSPKRTRLTESDPGHENEAMSIDGQSEAGVMAQSI